MADFLVLDDTSQKDKTPQVTTAFNGSQFFTVYKDAAFLREDDNIEELLTRGYLLRTKLRTVTPGDSIPYKNMKLEKNTPLLIKSTAKSTKVEDFEFTYNRVVSLAAGYVYENRRRFPKIENSEAKELGLVWDNSNDDKCKLYLSAVSGTEYLVELFSFWPLMCRLRKYQLEKLPIELVVKSGNIKNCEGITMAKVMKNNLVTAKRIWLMFENTSLRDLQTLIDSSPKIKKLFQG